MTLIWLNKKNVKHLSIPAPTKQVKCMSVVSPSRSITPSVDLGFTRWSTSVEWISQELRERAERLREREREDMPGVGGWERETKLKVNSLTIFHLILCDSIDVWNQSCSLWMTASRSDSRRALLQPATLHVSLLSHYVVEVVCLIPRYKRYSDTLRLEKPWDIHEIHREFWLNLLKSFFK